MKNKSILLGLLAAAALPLQAQTVYLLTADGKLATAPTGNFSANTTPVTLTGVTAGETLVAIDMRPQNQRLYALGVNPTTDTGTLYHISTQTGLASVVGVAGSVAFTTDGTTPVDFPDPATVSFDIDFNPTVDRLRVVTGSGLNFRIEPNSGAAVDGNTGLAGVNTDTNVNGVTATVSGTAYTNNAPNVPVTTQYTVDAATDSLFIQSLPNSGTQNLVATITQGGNPLDFSAASLDIVPGVNTATSNTAVSAGAALMVAKVAGTNRLYSVDLVTGAATTLNSTSLDVRSMAIATTLSTAMALDGTGSTLQRFSLLDPATTTNVGITGLTAGEQLVGMDSRPATGQVFALGVNFANNNATLYRLDPQTGTLTTIGSAGAILLTSGSFPDPASIGYGMDFNPTVDRIRVVASSGLNIRINPNTGTLALQDVALNGGTATATAYTNNFGGATATTQYSFNTLNGNLFIQNPPNNGTLTFVGNLSPFDFQLLGGFDIPPSVAVSTSGSAASGEGWMLIGRSGGAFTQLYRVDLATGAGVATGLFNSTTSAAGLIAWASVPNVVVQQPAGTTLTSGGSLQFGAAAGEGLATRTFTVFNTGSQPLTYRASLSGSAAFDISESNFVTVPGGGSKVFTVEYLPEVAGNETSTLTITSDDPDQPTFTSSLTGLGLIALADDKVKVTAQRTLLTPLANDSLIGDIVGVSDPSITFDGRTLFIPDGFIGTFTYNVSNGTRTGQATVTVTAATPVVAPKNFNGLLYTSTGDIVGTASATVSAQGIASLTVRGVAVQIKTKVAVNGSVFTNLGLLSLNDLSADQYGISIAALGGDIGGILRPAQLTPPVAKYNIALASTDRVLHPGGGFATATVSNKAAVKIVGVSVDGAPFTVSTFLSDNDSIAFYGIMTAALKPAAFIGGELHVADLTKTDITGELAYLKYSQPATSKYAHRGGMNARLTANGSRIPVPYTLPAGAGTIKISDGAQLVNETNAVTLTAGAPNIIGVLTVWKANAKTATFTGAVALGQPKTGKFAGVYLPKSNSAWGYFPSLTIGGQPVGGTIQITQP